MTRNPHNAWLAMLIFKATYIPNINKSPAELLNSRRLRTNLPIIDLDQNKSNESEIEILTDVKAKLLVQGRNCQSLISVPLYYMTRIQVLQT